MNIAINKVGSNNEVVTSWLIVVATESKYSVKKLKIALVL